MFSLNIVAWKGKNQGFFTSDLRQSWRFMLFHHTKTWQYAPNHRDAPWSQKGGVHYTQRTIHHFKRPEQGMRLKCGCVNCVLYTRNYDELRIHNKKISSIAKSSTYIMYASRKVIILIRVRLSQGHMPLDFATGPWNFQNSCFWPLSRGLKSKCQALQ